MSQSGQTNLTLNPLDSGCGSQALYMKRGPNCKGQHPIRCIDAGESSQQGGQAELPQTMSAMFITMTSMALRTQRLARVLGLSHHIIYTK